MNSAPRACYRLQLTPSFGFAEARALVDYLHDLGVSHLYASPVLEAVAGSQHGYDVVDHSRARRELGGNDGFAALSAALKERGMALLLDIVPNHMAIGTADNALWWDVLENGPASRYASFFDVDWDAAADNRVLLPVLGERYAEALEQKLIRVELADHHIVVRYRDRALPSAPRSLAPLLSAAARNAGERATELVFVADSLGQLEHAWTVDREGAAKRQRDKDALYAHLVRLLSSEPELERAVAHELELLSQDLDRLDAWLERQNWRLAYWKAAADELGYRRFFDVQTLAGLRVEDAAVFDATHAQILAWVQSGEVDGLRVDHPDGLRDPERYLRRLRVAAPDAYLVVEKILDGDEALRPSWPVDGTTGYDFMRLLDQVQVHPGGDRTLRELAAQMQPEPHDWAELTRAAKLEILERVLASERERVVELAHRVLTKRRPLRDATRAELRSALSHVLASYRGYRTYVQEDAPVDPLDRAAIDSAVSAARMAQPAIDARTWQAIEAALTLSAPYEHATDLALAVQQLTSAIAAKAVEDTACYRHLCLLALNEVGGSPGTFGIAREAFHRALAVRAGSSSMLATATHDTKRGEDVRARLIALSELAEPWSRAVTNWLQRSARYADALDPAIRYMFLQTLVGAAPLDVDRARAYMLKAAREAKLHTSWTDPNPTYEQSLERYVRGVLADAELQREIAAFLRRIARPGFVASLARTLIKLTAPGVPDIYQGNELWNLNLVDPDNRRPIDFELRRALLKKATDLTPETAMTELAIGTPKLWLIARTLRLRAASPELFEGNYVPLETRGEHESAVLAYARGDGLVVVAPRWPVHAELLGPDARVQLPAGRFRDVLCGGVVAGGEAGITKLWSRFPVALLARER